MHTIIMSKYNNCYSYIFKSSCASDVHMLGRLVVHEFRFDNKEMELSCDRSLPVKNFYK